MKLLNLQVELMQKQMDFNSKLIDEKKASREALVAKENGIRREISSEIVELELRNEEIKNTLAFGEVVVPNVDSDVVEIGSLVSLLFSDGEVEDVFLIEDNYANALTSSEVNFMSLSSPLGAAVFGKKQGDVISYEVGDKDRKSIIACEVIGVNNKVVLDKEFIKK